MKQWFANLPWKKWKDTLGAAWDRSGFAVVLLLCAGVIGVSMFIGSNTAGEEPEVEAESTPMATLRPIEAVRSAQIEPVAASTPEPTQPPLSLPLLGGEGEGYAPDLLIFSKTMGEWTTHDGIDLMAPEGTAVGAAADGVVAGAFEDPSWGNVVLIEHADGLMTGYASLGQIDVTQGESVTRGQRIGTAGVSALIEWEEGAHIHFYVVVDSETVNPRDYLR